MSPARRNPYTTFASPPRKRAAEVKEAKRSANPAIPVLSLPVLRQNVTYFRTQVEEIEGLVRQVKHFLEACDQVISTCEQFSHFARHRRGEGSLPGFFAGERSAKSDGKEKQAQEKETASGELDLGAIFELVQSPLFRTLLSGLGTKEKGE